MTRSGASACTRGDFARVEQPEPSESRSLAMLSKPGRGRRRDTAEETVRAIRDYPGLEKVSALDALAEWYEGKGDQARHIDLPRALRCPIKMPPDAPGWARPRSWGRSRHDIRRLRIRART